ncbi:GNAT family N-acetyltransferase [Ramlibacter albus]|uniref:GNAT family N-acetyltransferase n=1 Tax=Ramlibacter albus TaxID=2079448 RepID=A0A923M9U4_9BURK|nr:GNAT family N-acetyltransferase [Ramlibacter albus]MBC5766015.1 GNAT family N-acetyltransferase [Ramlibacter albus]
MDSAAHKADAEFTIRAQEPSDARAVSAMLGTPGTFEGLLQLPDMPVASRLEYHEKIEPGACRLVAVANDGLIIGSAGLHNIANTMRRAHVRMLGIGILPQWQGKGVGRALMSRLLDWADNWTTVLRIELTVHADNDRAIALYKSLGFVEEGRHRAYAIKDGRFVDAFSMARLHPNPPELPV